MTMIMMTVKSRVVMKRNRLKFIKKIKMKNNNIRLFFIIKSSIVLSRDIIDWTQKIPNPLLFSPSDCLSFNKSNVRQYHTVNPYLVPVCPGSNRHSIHPIPFLRSSRDRVESLSRPV